MSIVFARRFLSRPFIITSHPDGSFICIYLLQTRPRCVSVACTLSNFVDFHVLFSNLFSALCPVLFGEAWMRARSCSLIPFGRVSRAHARSLRVSQSPALNVCALSIRASLFIDVRVRGYSAAVVNETTRSTTQEERHRRRAHARAHACVDGCEESECGQRTPSFSRRRTRPRKKQKTLLLLRARALLIRYF